MALSGISYNGLCKYSIFPFPYTGIMAVIINFFH